MEKRVQQHGKAPGRYSVKGRPAVASTLTYGNRCRARRACSISLMLQWAGWFRRGFAAAKSSTGMLTMIRHFHPTTRSLGFSLALVALVTVAAGGHRGAIVE